LLHAEALQVVATQEPALQTLPEPQSVQATPPFPHAAFTFAATQPASPVPQQVLQLLGPQSSPASWWPPLLPLPLLLPPPPLLPPPLELPLPPLLVPPPELPPPPPLLLELLITSSPTMGASSVPPSSPPPSAPGCTVPSGPPGPVE
jgi:hypothetical protein